MIDNELKEHCLQEAGIDLGRYSYNELNVIKDALRRYHNAKLKLLSIDDGSGLACKCGNQIFIHRHSNWIECIACNKIHILQA